MPFVTLQFYFVVVESLLQFVAQTESSLDCRSFLQTLAAAVVVATEVVAAVAASVVDSGVVAQ